MIVQNQQKRDEIIESYIKRSICGYDNTDPKVCCSSLIFSNPNVVATTSSPAQPAPFIFSSITSGPPPNGQTPATSTPPVTTPPSSNSQPTFSPLSPTPNNPPTRPNPPTNPPTNPSNPTYPSSVIFSPVTSSPPTQTSAPPPAGPIINRLPTVESDKCGISYAVRSRIVG